MPFELQVKDVQNDVAIQKISGVRPDSAEFFAYLNEVEKALMNRGGWFDLERCVQFCITGHHIVWPEFVGTVLAVHFCGDNVAVSRNKWYSFVSRGQRFGNRNGGYDRNLGLGFGSGFGVGVNNRDVIIQDSNSRPCYNDISGGSGRYIRYYITDANDVGKKITIFGRKFGGLPLQEKENGQTVEGLTLTANNPFVSTFDLVTGIESIVREPTVGPAYLFEYDPACGTLRDIAAYRPGETHPRYRASLILNVPRRTMDAQGCCWTPIEALVKLKFIELVHERDFIPVDNLRAVKLGFQAVKLEEANQDDKANEKWAAAVHELNLENLDKQPDDQMTIENNTFGDVGVPHRRIW